MRLSKKYVILGALAAVVSTGFFVNKAVTQNSPERDANRMIYETSIPIKFHKVTSLQAPGQMVAALNSSAIKDENIGVIDLSFEVDADSAGQLAPSLQPKLFMGSRSYGIQRMEYDNWDPKSEKAIDLEKPVGKKVYYHFFIPRNDIAEMREHEVAVLTTLTPRALFGFKEKGLLTPALLRNNDPALLDNAEYLTRGIFSNPQ